MKVLDYMHVKIFFFDYMGLSVFRLLCQTAPNAQTLPPDIILPFASNEIETQHDGGSLLYR